MLSTLRCVVGMLVICPAAVAADACRDPQWYQDHQYWVQRIRIETPLQFLGPVQRAVADLKSVLPLRERTRGADGRLLEQGAFTVGALNAGIPALRDHFNPLRVSPMTRVAARLIAPPQIENCDDSQHSVDAVYRVYSFQLGSGALPVLEGMRDQIERSVPATGITRALDRFLPSPLIGYDRSRSLYGGTRLSLRHLEGPVHTADFDILGSANSLIWRVRMNLPQAVSVSSNGICITFTVTSRPDLRGSATDCSPHSSLPKRNLTAMRSLL
jgi:hypothetical protein